METIELKPLGDRVAVIPLVPSSDRVGSIFIPDSVKRGKANQGVVRFVGAGVKSLRPGDHVVFSPYAGTKWSLVGEGDLIILREHSVDLVVDLIAAERSLLPRPLVESVLADLGVRLEDFNAALESRTFTDMEW